MTTPQAISTLRDKIGSAILHADTSDTVWRGKLLDIILAQLEAPSPVRGEDEYMTVTLSQDGTVTSHNAFDADFDEMVVASQKIITELQRRLSDRKFCPYSHGGALRKAEPVQSDDLLREALDRLKIQISGGLCYHTAEGKHAQLTDAAKTVDEALALLEATPSHHSQGEIPEGEAGGWRDISTFNEPTALGSGNGVLVSDANGTVGEAYFRAFDDDDRGWWWANTTWGDYPSPDRPNQPTHWMPLPDAYTPKPESDAIDQIGAEGRE